MNESTQYDAAWKQTLERFLPDFLKLAFPDLAASIDWSAPVSFLDTELQEIVRESESGLMRVDKLVEVRRRDGAGELLLIHAEVQAQRDDALPERMFRYFCRIMDRFRRFPVSVAVLADPTPNWKPTRFVIQEHGCGVEFEFPVCKLSELDLEPWLAAGNPVARVIQAHRLAQKTGGNPLARREGKLGLVRNLLLSGVPEQEIREVLRLIHWLLALSAEEEQSFRQDLRRLQEKLRMPNLSPYDRIVWEEGRVEGRVEGRHEGRLTALREMLMEHLSIRFGPLGIDLQSRIEAIQDEKELQRLARWVISAPSLEEFSRAISG